MKIIESAYASKMERIGEVIQRIQGESKFIKKDERLFFEGWEFDSVPDLDISCHFLQVSRKNMRVQRTCEITKAINVKSK